MNRKEAIRNLTVLGALTLAPGSLLFGNHKKKTTHFIGLGWAGTKVLETFYRKGVNGKYTCIHERKSEILAIHHVPFISPKKSYFSKKYDKEIIYGSDFNQKLIMPNVVTELFKKNERFVLIGGLGHYTGTYMVEELTLMLHESKGDFLTICSLPFEFETPGRQKAIEVFEKLKHIPNVTYFDMNTFGEKQRNTHLPKIFEMSHEEFYVIYDKNKFTL
jgi:cell division GTPase FtsZ